MHCRFVLLLILTAGLVGCTTPNDPSRTPLSQAPAWHGRLSVTLHSEPPQVNGGQFSLHGSPHDGALWLYSPLGNTVAQLHWHGSQVQLVQGQDQAQFASMDALTTQFTGAALPVAALFDWLQGRAHEVPGWQADLSQLNQGTLHAQRVRPLPAVTLRVKIDP